MWPFSQYTTAGRAALTYISVGALTTIWAGVWYVYLVNNPPAEGYYWCTGFLVTGLVMVLVGAVLGMISRSEKRAGLPPAGTPLAVVSLEPNVATAPVLAVAPPKPTSPVVATNGQVVLVPPQAPVAGTKR